MWLALLARDELAGLRVARLLVLAALLGALLLGLSLPTRFVATFPLPVLALGPTLLPARLPAPSFLSTVPSPLPALLAGLPLAALPTDLTLSSVLGGLAVATALPAPALLAKRHLLGELAPAARGPPLATDRAALSRAVELPLLAAAGRLLPGRTLGAAPTELLASPALSRALGPLPLLPSPFLSALRSPSAPVSGLTRAVRLLLAAPSRSTASALLTPRAVLS